MSQEYQYFYEDEVYRVTRGNLEFGMVLENGEFVSSDDDSDTSDFDEKVTSGKIRVGWYPKGIDEVVQERKVGLAARSLMPGDVVRRMIRGMDTQRGYCRQVYVKSSVQVVGTKFVIMDVDSSSLHSLAEFAPDVAVALDSWVGMVSMSKCDIHFETSDGSKLILAEHEALELEESSYKMTKDYEFRRYSLYPGGEFTGPVKSLEKARWLHKTKEMENMLTKQQRVISLKIEHVKVVQLGVRWQCRAFSSDVTADKEQPKYIIEGDDLKRIKMLNVFEPSTVQLGDHNFYTATAEDTILTKDKWKILMKSKLSSDMENPFKPHVSKKSAKNKEDEEKEEIELSSSEESADTQKGDEIEDSSDTASVSSVTSAGSQGSRTRKPPTLATRILRNKKLKKSRKKKKKVFNPVKLGEKLVVETLMTSSTVDVVWQDGTVEEKIPSTALFPIHHLDDQEFFPGDFVIEQRDSVDSQEYGVIQCVQHAGRTAKVKWFRTYIAGHEPKPTLKGEDIVSVYDLRDHPDFRYRPGSVVIRVANFECTKNSPTGQVLDNLPSGEVSVWWIDGSRSLCYPQDLYKVGEYDSDDGELWDDSTSEASWETQSEHSVITEDVESDTDNQLKTKLVVNIEKARIAMSRLEELFTQNPSLQTTMVMKQLLDCYKECRYMDRLLGTSFFHESKFQGMIERVREKGRASTSQRMAEQFNRLFSSSESDNIPNGNPPTEAHNREEMLASSANLCENLANLSMSSMKWKCKGHETIKRMSETDMLGDRKSAIMKDSKSCNDFAMAGSAIPNSQSEDFKTSHMCAHLCLSMKTQLLKTYEEVVSRYGGHFDMSLMQKCSEGDGVNGEIKEAVSSDVSQNDNESQTPTQTSENEVFESELNGAIAKSPKFDTSDFSELNGFEVVESAPDSHKFKLTMFQPTDPPHFYRTVQKEMKLLKSSLPPAIWVKSYEDRMDLFSVMIRGPSNTPYEDGLLFFDFQLAADYPRAPPLCHYATYCSDKLNPNLYEDGRVCISLLGTWRGKGTEVWTENSNLLQVIVSIQGLILVSEPYFNEAGYERQKGTQQGRENSRMYNEMVVLKLIQAMSKIVQNPPDIFRKEIFAHFQSKAANLVKRLEYWLQISENYNKSHPLSPTTPTTFRGTFKSGGKLPEYPLVPASKGFCLTLRKYLENFKLLLITHGLLSAEASKDANKST